MSPLNIMHLLIILNIISWTEAVPEPSNELTVNLNINEGDKTGGSDDQSDSLYQHDHSNYKNDDSSDKGAEEDYSSDCTEEDDHSSDCEEEADQSSDYEEDVVSYEGYQLYQIKVRNSSEADKLKLLQKENKFDFWKDVTIGRNEQVLASPENTEELKHWLKENGLESYIGIEDIGELAKVTTKANDYGFEEMNWDDYHSTETIYEWMDQLEASCSFCKQEHIGKSREGQDMRVMKVCQGECGRKPAIWIDSGMHAREWISPAVGTWILNELVNNHPDLTKNLDWYFLPMINPDGYRLTRNGKRMHRKSTSKQPGVNCKHSDRSGHGVDLNRNFDFQWGGNSGASDDPCDNSYHGPRPFSEIESRNVRDIILKYNKNKKLKVYLSLHSHHQQMLSVWAYSKDPSPNDVAIQSLASRGAVAIKAVHGMVYEHGCSPCVNGGPLTGTSKDWAYGVAGIPYSYTLELRDNGTYGFLLPSNQIIPNAEEIWAFIDVTVDQITQEYGESK